MSFSNLSHFYQNFSELYGAGIDPASTIESLQSRSNVHDRNTLQIVSYNLRKGRSLYHSLKVAHCVPVFDLPLVKAAEDSGRIIDIFKNLSQKHRDTDEAIKKMRGSLIKPFFTLAVALMFPGIVDFFSQKISLSQYLKGSVGVLILICAVVFFIYNYWVQSYFDIEKARTLHRILSSLPIFRGLTARMAIEKFSSTLAFMQESSIDFYESLKQASQCSANPKIQAATERVVRKLQAGDDLQSAFHFEAVFPSDFVTAISLGSQSGKLPEFLRRYSDGLKSQNERTVQMLVKFFPIILYWLILAQAIYFVVTFYTGYLDEVLKIAP